MHLIKEHLTINKEQMEAFKEQIKEYCKIHKLKFIKYINEGFIAGVYVPVVAGFEIDLHSNKIVSFPFKKVGKKNIKRKFICYFDGDIVDNGIHTH
jgi:hypothetical protein